MEKHTDSEREELMKSDMNLIDARLHMKPLIFINTPNYTNTGENNIYRQTIIKV